MKKNNFIEKSTSLLVFFALCNLSLHANILTDTNNWDEYNAGSLNGQHGWTRISGNASQIQVVDGSQNYVYMNSATMTEDIRLNLSSSVDRHSVFFATSFSITSIIGSDYFMSFEGKVDSSGSLYALAGRLYAKQSDDGYVLGITSHSTSMTKQTAKLNLGEVYTAVTEYNLATGMTSFWLNPESSYTPPTLVAEDIYTSYEMDSVVLRNGAGDIELNIYNIVASDDLEETISNIPEPSTYALFISAGLVGVIVIRRRKK
jgi:hypothetical protein